MFCNFYLRNVFRFAPNCNHGDRCNDDLHPGDEYNDAGSRIFWRDTSAHLQKEQRIAINELLSLVFLFFFFRKRVVVRSLLSYLDDDDDDDVDCVYVISVSGHDTVSRHPVCRLLCGDYHFHQHS